MSAKKAAENVMLLMLLSGIYKDHPSAAYVVLRHEAGTVPDDVAAEFDVFDNTGKRLACWQWALGVPHPDALLAAWVKTRGERILSAAVWVDDGIAHANQSTPTGVIVGGWRHHACLNAASSLTEGRRPNHRRHQGFLTATGRFVDRREAKRIAVAAGQVDPGRGLLSADELDSGDLY